MILSDWKLDPSLEDLMPLGPEAPRNSNVCAAGAVGKKPNLQLGDGKVLGNYKTW